MSDSGLDALMTRRTSRFVTVALVALAVCLVWRVVLVMVQRSQIRGLRSDLARQALASQKTSQDVSRLREQLSSLLSGEDTSSIAGLQGQVTTLSSRLTSVEGRVKEICAKGKISAMESNIWGQESATQNPDYNYFDNLPSIMDAICASSPGQS